MIPYLLFSMVLLLVALWMHAHHRRVADRLESHPSMSPHKADFLRGQVKRRTKITYLVFALALAFLFGPLIGDPLAYVAYWFAVMSLVLWMLLIGLVDTIWTWNYLSTQRDQQAARKRALEEQARHKLEAKRESSP